MNIRRSMFAWLGIWAVLSCTPALQAQTITGTSAAYSFNDFGADTLTTTGTSSTLVTGYGLVEPGGGTTTPPGVAIFGYQENGILVTEAGVPATQTILSGRTYAEVNGPVNTGIAIANPSSVTATISFYFTNSATGLDFGQGSFPLAAGAQFSAFLNQAPFNALISFAGSFTFSSSVPVGVIALRGFTNERSDFLITTQTVTPLAGSVSTSPIAMAHFADGGGWQTSVQLVNTGDQPMNGTVQFYNEGSAAAAAQPITLTVNGQLAASFSYALPAHSSVSLETAGLGTSSQVGSVLVTPAGGSNAPAGNSLFSFVNNGVTVTAASVPAQPASTAFRMYVEASGTPGQIGSIESGIAITNTATTATSATLTLYDLNGTSTGLTVTLNIAASGHKSAFLDELFPSLAGPFKGVLRITTLGSRLAVVGLRTRYNQRGDFLVTTTPASNETVNATQTPAIFPHIANGAGYTTEFILFSGTTSQSGTGLIPFYSKGGLPLTLSYQ